MPMITPTVEQVTATIKAVVEEFGADYVYPYAAAPADCRYTEYDENGPTAPSCIAGHVLHRLGVPLDELRQWEGNNIHGLQENYINLPAGAYEGLSAAQEAQDGGKTWGEALNIYNERVSQYV